MGRL
jgi:hypothetical protein